MKVRIERGRATGKEDSVAIIFEDGKDNSVTVCGMGYWDGDEMDISHLSTFCTGPNVEGGFSVSNGGNRDKVVIRSIMDKLITLLIG